MIGASDLSAGAAGPTPGPDLASLLARLEAVTGPDRDLEIDIWRAIGGGHIKPLNRVPLPWLACYLTSLDDALTLLDHVLPGATWERWDRKMVVFCDGSPQGSAGHDTHGAAHALTVAVVRAALSATRPAAHADGGGRG